MHIVMELCSGGDVDQHMRARHGHHFSEVGSSILYRCRSDSGATLIRTLTLSISLYARCCTQDAVMHVFVQLLLALNHIHDKGIIHRFALNVTECSCSFRVCTCKHCSVALHARDLKLCNLFLLERSHHPIVKVGDFGISKQLEEGIAATVVGETSTPDL